MERVYGVVDRVLRDVRVQGVLGWGFVGWMGVSSVVAMGNPLGGWLMGIGGLGSAYGGYYGYERMAEEYDQSFGMGGMGYFDGNDHIEPYYNFLCLRGLVIGIGFHGVVALSSIIHLLRWVFASDL